MITGWVESDGRVLVNILVSDPHSKASARWEAWIDTGFTGDLVVPQPFIASLGLQLAGTVAAVLADGSVTTLDRFECLIDWFGSRQLVELVVNQGTVPLVGYGMLNGRKLTIDYSARTVTLE